MDIQSVRFRQSGGFAGLVRGSEMAGEHLDPQHRRALEGYLQGARPASPEGASRARDLIVYELEVDTGAGVVRLEFDEAGVPPDLAALVDALASRARPMPL